MDSGTSAASSALPAASSALLAASSALPSASASAALSAAPMASPAASAEPPSPPPAPTPSLPAWDPDAPSSMLAPTAFALKRLRNELRELLGSPLPGICLIPDDALAMRMHALVSGPSDTAYEGGFFYFVLQVPHNYPDSPPLVKLMTTGGGTVRFNPNTYRNGKVCLSIIGTWSGPGWSSALTLSAVLLSIQSLLGSSPLNNEPGLELVTDSARLAAYNAAIAHETLRVAVIDNVARPGSMPAALREVLLTTFSAQRDIYRALAERLRHLDGSQLQDSLNGENKGTFSFSEMGRRVEELQEALERGELE